MKYDANGKPVEDLAESYTFDKDTNTYTFKLRDGVKWHDGEDFNAEDVVYTYKELTEDETLGASITSNYQDITSIEAPDDQTVIFTLDQYDAAMLDYFTMGILPEHLLEGEEGCRHRQYQSESLEPLPHTLSDLHLGWQG